MSLNEAACQNSSVSRMFPAAAESRGAQTDGCSSRDADQKETQRICHQSVCEEAGKPNYFHLFVLQNEEN